MRRAGAGGAWLALGAALVLLLAAGGDALYIYTEDADVYAGPGGTVAADYRTPGAAREYGSYVSTAEFLFTSTADHLDYYTTIQEAFSSPVVTVVEGEDVIEPYIFGDAAEGYYFDGQTYWPEVPSLSLVFNCRKDGSAAVKVDIRTSLLHNDGGPTTSVNETVTFFMRKQCFSTGYREGFAVALETGVEAAEVVRHGVVQHAWAFESAYLMDETPATLGAGQHMAVFQLYIMNAYYGNQYFGPPSAVADDEDLLSVKLRGSAEYGGVATTAPETLVLFFECLGKGETTVTVEVPLGFYGTLEFGFVKECKAGGEEATAEPGLLHVGTSRAAYAGVVHASTTSFEWSPDGPSAAVGPEDYSTVFYLSTESGRNQTVLPPVVSVHPTTAFRTSLSGPLREGGVTNGLPQRLVVNYICDRVAEAQVTVTIHLPHRSPVEFAYTKQCKPVKREGYVWTANQVLFLIMITVPLGSWAAYTYFKKSGASLP